MKRLLLALVLLPLAALAQTNLNVSVTYTPGAAAAAAAAGTTVQTRVAGILSNINAAYAASGIDGQLTGFYGAAGNTAPSDSSDMVTQYAWVKLSVASWRSRTNVDASISVHVTGTTGYAGAMQSSTADTGGPEESTIAIPYSQLDALEFAIGKILNMKSGFSVRARTYPTDPGWHGANVCYHTRESARTDDNQLIPYLPYWRVYPPGNAFQPNGMTTSDSINPSNSCMAYLDYMGVTYNRTTYANWSLSNVTSASATCVLSDTSHVQTATAPIQYFANPGSGTISCMDSSVTVYSKNAMSAAPGPGMPVGTPSIQLGNANFDSVYAMNNRIPTVYAWSSRNGTIRDMKTVGSFWLGMCQLPGLCLNYP